MLWLGLRFGVNTAFFVYAYIPNPTLTLSRTLTLTDVRHQLSIQTLLPSSLFHALYALCYSTKFSR